jgi:hypothetical protein
MEGWHIECCHPPPGVGDQVSWPLLWVDADGSPGALQLDWHSRPLAAGSWVDPTDLLLRHGPLVACWRGRTTVPTRGQLLADVHGGVPEQVPPATGTVLGVEIVNQAYRLAGPRTYVPIPGDVVLRPVTHSPQRFDSRAATAEPPPDLYRQDSGVLVRLAVDGSST